MISIISGPAARFSSRVAGLLKGESMIGAVFDANTVDRGRAQSIVQKSNATLFHVISTDDAWLAREVLSWRGGKANVIFRYFPAWRGSLGDDNLALGGGVDAMSLYVNEAIARTLDTRVILSLDNEPVFPPGATLDERARMLRKCAEVLIYGAEKAAAQGYKVVLGNFATGTLKADDWRGGLLPLLRYAGEHPDRVAIGTHEYVVKVGDSYYEGRSSGPGLGGDLIGNYRHILAAAASLGLPVPNTVVTEIGIYPRWEEYFQGDESRYADWLVALDDGMYSQDRAVIGILPFICGGGDQWKAFDLKDKTVFLEKVGAHNRARGMAFFEWPAPDGGGDGPPPPGGPDGDGIAERLARVEKQLDALGTMALRQAQQIQALRDMLRTIARQLADSV